MSYARALKRLLIGYRPSAEHLYLLEPFQVERLKVRMDPAGMAAILHADPTLRRVLARKHPSFEAWADTIMDAHGTEDGNARDALWEIADLLVYVAAPEIYDAVAGGAKHLEHILEVADLGGRAVADVGAGTGRLAMAMARHARVVYAVEPVQALRQWIRVQAERLELDNLFVVDGFHHALPFPRASIDVVTSVRAIGWELSKEIDEVDRVLRPGGLAVHLTGLPVAEDAPNDALHAGLDAAGYVLEPYHEPDGWKRRYLRPA